MPEFTGEVTTRSLLITAGITGLCVAAFSLGVTLAARRFAAGTVWIASGILIGGFCVIAYANLYLDPLVVRDFSVFSAVFFLVSLLGLPSASAVWVAVRRAARVERGRLLIDSLLVTTTFAVVLPFAAVVASVP